MTAKATSEKAATVTSSDDGILVIGDPAEEPKFDVLFRIRGKEYKGLANPDGSLLFRYLNLNRTQGANIAVDWLFEQMLDPEARQALMTDRAVSKADFGKVRDLLLNLLFSREADPKSQRSGSRRTSG